MAQNITRRGRWLVAGIPLAWLALLFLLRRLLCLLLGNEADFEQLIAQ